MICVVFSICMHSIVCGNTLIYAVTNSKIDVEMFETNSDNLC